MSIRRLQGVTVGVAPVLRSTERAQKRKEFNAMLKKKQRVLEAEKREYEATLKEEEEEAIKELRKGMVVKAHSIPSFYYEEPPPKVELKKAPLTRPRSPKLIAHRRSCSDTSNLTTDENGFCSRLLRNSVDTCRGGSVTSNNKTCRAGSASTSPIKHRRECSNRWLY